MRYTYTHNSLSLFVSHDDAATMRHGAAVGKHEAVGSPRARVFIQGILQLREKHATPVFSVHVPKARSSGVGREDRRSNHTAHTKYTAYTYKPGTRNALHIHIQHKYFARMMHAQHYAASMDESCTCLPSHILRTLSCPLYYYTYVYVYIMLVGVYNIAINITVISGGDWRNPARETRMLSR